MNSMVDALYEVKHNPFKHGPLIASFFFALTGVERNLLLAQLVIPLCCHPIYSKKLKNAKFGEKSASSLWTIFEDRTQLHDLQERIDDFLSITRESLHYCLANDWMDVDAQRLSASQGKAFGAVKTEKTALNLAKIFSNLSAPQIYSFLEIVPR
jgi:hypothetical protein